MTSAPQITTVSGATPRSCPSTARTSASVQPEGKVAGRPSQRIGTPHPALCTVAEEAGRERGVAPVRPTVKARYPLTPIETSMRWTREDGSALDPWIRTHQRLGATLVSAAPESQVMTGTVAEWERWTGLAFPETGDYVIPEGLALLHVDRESDEGVYREPNVWMRHR
ncbi:hypothetical protein ACWEPD_10260 [Streptomyces pseudogriseolus]